VAEDLVIVESEGALFKCKPMAAPLWRYRPVQIWDFDEERWVPYADAGEFKQHGWGGNPLNEAEFEKLRRKIAAADAIG
jgi:hypothetical protein